MSRRRRFRRRSRSAYKVWGVVGLIVAAGTLSTKYYSNNQERLSQYVELGLVSLIVAVLGCGMLLVAYVLRERRLNSTPGFINQPWVYDQQIAWLLCEVVREIPVDWSTKIKRFSVDFFRSLVRHGDPTHRYPHQRFLVTLPGLRKGDRIMIIHNTDYGSIAVRKGQWLEVQGVYQHLPKLVRGAFGSRRPSFYGQVHKTHPPEGFLQIVDPPVGKVKEFVRVQSRGRRP